MTGIEASRLANEYRQLWVCHHPENMSKARAILEKLCAEGWGRLAQLLREEG